LTSKRPTFIARNIGGTTLKHFDQRPPMELDTLLPRIEIADALMRARARHRTP